MAPRADNQPQTASSSPTASTFDLPSTQSNQPGVKACTSYVYFLFFLPAGSYEACVNQQCFFNELPYISTYEHTEKNQLPSKYDKNNLYFFTHKKRNYKNNLNTVLNELMETRG